jgi:gamma-glutamyltranspeptidase/glutathione hydrolase
MVDLRTARDPGADRPARPAARRGHLLDLRAATLVLLAALLASGDAASGGDRVTGRAFASRSEVISRHGMIATSHPLATDAGLDVLKRGGSAVDAAIAANAVLALVEPTGCGLGGDVMAIVHDAESKQLHGLLGIGRSPRELTPEALVRALAAEGLVKIPAHGPLPVTVPGCVDGWIELHARFGRLPLAEVLSPAIRHAREGFPVTELIAYYWERNGRTLAKYPGFAEQFLPGGRAPGKGDVFRNEGFAATLEAIASQGRDGFYAGPIAERIVGYLREQGGAHTLEDFATHRSEWVTPIATHYRGCELHELPPPTQGLAALQILELLEGFEFAPDGFFTADHIHRFVEAKKLAFEDRARFYADPAFAEQPIAGLLSDDYSAARRALIRDDRAARAVDAGNPALEEGDTICLAVGDAAGNMVSLIQSNYRGMGSGMTPPGLGFVLHDRGELFDVEPGRPNSYAPGKRPFHTIIPAFVTRNGEPWIAFGVMGGAMQPQAHAQIVMNLVDFAMNLQEAGDAPRIQHGGSSEPTGERMSGAGHVWLETGADWEVVRELIRRGHEVGYDLGGYGGYQAVMRDSERGVWFGASESRKDGQAAGY